MYKVLVADDHAIVRSGISYLVNQQPGFTVVDGTASGTDTYLRIEQGGDRYINHGPQYASWRKRPNHDQADS
ncbi:hypothetical protein HMPREF9265_0104 [Limosilactobacillus oris PB013-T2-3]|uniref:Response regulatory domain-containing protein n=1 Tax=Limosilactobacillus oris PB013-T2-3 TaxID=908339 RepID=E3C5E0_9LACO|nr:hypothetical protein HMPREF9265_0104 [Limosilactobacillus oris PB013-T2-3]